MCLDQYYDSSDLPTTELAQIVDETALSNQPCNRAVGCVKPKRPKNPELPRNISVHSQKRHNFLGDHSFRISDTFSYWVTLIVLAPHPTSFSSQPTYSQTMHFLGGPPVAASVWTQTYCRAWSVFAVNHRKGEQSM